MSESVYFGDNDNMYYDDKVIFFMSGGEYITDVVVQPFVDRKSVKKVHVPKKAKLHRKYDCYMRFPNLEEIIAHPDSNTYTTFDGALYDKSGTLIYVPNGKKHLKIAPFIRRIEYRAFWNHNNLTEITIDSSNDYYFIYNGCLYSNDKKKVYFVANSEHILYLFPETEEVSEDVYSLNISSIIVDEKNPYYEVQNERFLIRKGGPYCYITSENDLDCINISSSVTEISVNTAMQLFGPSGSRTIRTDNHPIFQVKKNVLYNTKKKEIIFVCPNVITLVVADGYSLGMGCLLFASSLKTISIPYDLVGMEEALYTNKTINKEQLNYELIIRWSDGKKSVIWGNVIKIMNIIKSGMVEVKSGTEILYLELYLAGRITNINSLRNFMVSRYQIIIYLIDTNDINRLKRVIDDGTLISKRNITRIKTYARKKNRSEMIVLLNRIIFK